MEVEADTSNVLNQAEQWRLRLQLPLQPFKSLIENPELLPVERSILIQEKAPIGALQKTTDLSSALGSKTLERRQPFLFDGTRHQNHTAAKLWGRSHRFIIIFTDLEPRLPGEIPD